MKPTIAIRLGSAVVVAFLLSLTPAYAADSSTSTTDLTKKFQAAGLKVDDLRAVEVGGIVVLRGRSADKASAAQASLVAQNLGFLRVANLIQVVEPIDDEKIERVAERQLGIHRSLDGCDLRVDSDHGVVRITGRVASELQKDVAIQLVRNVDGVRSVQSELRRQ